MRYPRNSDVSLGKIFSGNPNKVLSATQIPSKHERIKIKDLSALGNASQNKRNAKIKDKIPINIDFSGLCSSCLKNGINLYNEGVNNEIVTIKNVFKSAISGTDHKLFSLIISVVDILFITHFFS